ncbi:hypothetical protein VSR34_38745, partial [Paraburkholderia sp. JHI2823]|uniref:hypothetical protein n=1 Tax=Paraburkholderia sp. JHI2823 TaxID=3112960 RepID=UPI0031796E0C
MSERKYALPHTGHKKPPRRSLHQHGHSYSVHRRERSNRRGFEPYQSERNQRIPALSKLRAHYKTQAAPTDLR